MCAARDSRGREGPGKQIDDGKGGKCRDERWRPAGVVNVQVDVCSASGRVGGGSGCNIEKSEAASRW